MHRSRYYVFAVLSLHQYDSLTFSNFASTATWAFLYPIYRYIGKDLFLSRTFVSEHVSFLFSHAFISWFGFMHVRWHRIVAMSPFKIMEANTWFLMLYNVTQCTAMYVHTYFHLLACFCILAFLHVYIRAYIFMFILLLYVFICIFTSIHMHVHTFMFFYTHTCSHNCIRILQI